MKNFYKFLGCLFSVCFLLCFSNVKGLKVEELSWNFPSSSERYLSRFKISDAIEKKEEIIIKKANFSEELNKCGYEYIKVSKNIHYLEVDSQNPIASTSIDVNLRYNPLNRESECISSYENTVIYNDRYILNVSSKSLNKTTEIGSNTTNICLKYLSIPIYSEYFEMDCTHLGEISFYNL